MSKAKAKLGKTEKGTVWENVGQCICCLQ